MADVQQASGVEELIQRLRESGVEEGQARADALFQESRQRAGELLEQARREAAEIRKQARDEAARVRAAGEEAVRLAVRDAMLTLKNEIVDHFSSLVRRLASQTLEHEQFLQRLILEVARRAVPEEEEAGRMEVLLPPQVVGVEDLRSQPEEVREGTLTHFVHSLTREILREGLTFSVAGDEISGLRVRLADEDVQIELTDKAVTDLLLRHLLPRFRVLVEGVAP